MFSIPNMNATQANLDVLNQHHAQDKMAKYMVSSRYMLVLPLREVFWLRLCVGDITNGVLSSLKIQILSEPRIGNMFPRTFDMSIGMTTAKF